MKLTAPPCLLAALPLAISLLVDHLPAQTRSHTTAHSTGARTAACAKLPEISAKVPALPAGLPCARHLYTLTTTPSARFDYTSPLEDGAALRDYLGIEPTSFSLDYVDVKAGNGALALPHKWYTIHYTGYLADGTKFDSSVDRGTPFIVEIGLHHVIPGWDTGFAGMRLGGKRRLFIPFELAYGPSGRPPTVPAKAELIFDVELIAQSDTDPTPAPPPPPAAPPAATPQPSAPQAAPAPKPQ